MTDRLDAIRQWVETRDVPVTTWIDDMDYVLARLDAAVAGREGT